MRPGRQQQTERNILYAVRVGGVRGGGCAASRAARAVRALFPKCRQRPSRRAVFSPAATSAAMSGYVRIVTRNRCVVGAFVDVKALNYCLVASGP